MLVSSDSPHADARLRHRLDPGVYCATCSAETFRDAALFAASGAFERGLGTNA
jgi:hypothetical protein